MIALDVRGLLEPEPTGPAAYAIPIVEALLRDRPDLYIGWAEGSPPGEATLVVDLGGRNRLRRELPTAVAVHDTSGLAGLGGLGRRFRLGWVTGRAGLVLAPSNLIAEAAVRYLRLPDHRVIGARPGLGDTFTRSSRTAAEAIRDRLGLPERYFVFVGSIRPRKNLAVLAEAWAAVRGRLGDGIGLVIAGPEAGVRAPTGLGVVTTGFVPQDLLPGLLSGAIAYLNSSSYEGCPQGTMEAMACGCPPVVGRGTALMEPMRGAGILVDSNDPGQWARAMTVLAGSREERAKLSAECRRLADGFSARKAAAELSSSLEAALGEHPNQPSGAAGVGSSR